jgi:hypothetical protein
MYAKEHQQSEEADEYREGPHRDPDRKTGALTRGERALKTGWAYRWGRRACAGHGQPKGNRDDREHPVHERNAGDEVQRRCERPALVVCEGIGPHRYRRDPERNRGAGDSIRAAGRKQ